MKSSEQHKIDGTYREDRQGGRMEDTMPCESPICPGQLSESAKTLFNLHCMTVPLKHQAKLDAPILAMTATAATEMYLCIGELQDETAGDKDYSRVQRQISIWYRLLENGANHLGWSPKARMKIRASQRNAAEAPDTVQGLRDFQSMFRGN